MLIEMSEFVEDGITATDEESIAQLRRLTETHGCVRSWAEQATDTGQLVSAYAVVILRPGSQYDLPQAAAQKLIDIGYAIAAAE